MMSQLLNQKEAPFLLTLLLGTMAWLLTHAVDRLQSAPLVEYRLVETGAQVTCTIENLCVDRCFRDLRFTLSSPDGLTNSAVQLLAPGKTRNEPLVLSPTVEFVLQEFHPGWRVHIQAKRQGTRSCQLTVESLSEENEVPEEIAGLRMVPPGASTFVVRHEMTILMILLLGLFAGGFAYLRALIATEPKSST